MYKNSQKRGFYIVFPALFSTNLTLSKSKRREEARIASRIALDQFFYAPLYICHSVFAVYKKEHGNPHLSFDLPDS